MAVATQERFTPTVSEKVIPTLPSTRSRASIFDIFILYLGQ